MNFQVKLDRIIKEVWIEKIIPDLDRDFALMEDTLKNLLYYHLRTSLGDGYLNRNLIRIYTEYRLDNGQKADIAVVRLKPRADIFGDYHVTDRVLEVLSLIEIKYKGTKCNTDPFYGDVDKVRKLIRLKKYKNCQFYLAFVHETFYTNEETPWLSNRQQNSWAKGRLTELSACYETKGSNQLQTTIISYNNLNSEFNFNV